MPIAQLRQQALIIPQCVAIKILTFLNKIKEIKEGSKKF